MKLTNYLVHKTSEDYFYLTPNFTPPPRVPSVTQHHRHSSSSPLPPPPSTLTKRFIHGRCSTPSPSPAPLTNTRTHKRSISWSATQHNTTNPLLSLSPFPLSRSSLESIPSTLDYDASRSNSVNSFAFPLSPIDRSMSEDVFWLVMRVLPSKVEVYLHNK